MNIQWKTSFVCRVIAERAPLINPFTINRLIGICTSSTLEFKSKACCLHIIQANNNFIIKNQNKESAKTFCFFCFFFPSIFMDKKKHVTPKAQVQESWHNQNLEIGQKKRSFIDTIPRQKGQKKKQKRKIWSVALEELAMPLVRVNYFGGSESITCFFW